MKTSKRKRSSAAAKAEPAVEAAGVEVTAAESSPAAEPVAVESAAAESVAVAIEAQAAEPVAVAVEPAPAESAEPAGEPIIVLAANCSVKDAAALKTSLCAAALDSADVTLDASAVERVDTATIQLLCAFVRDRSSRNQGVTWRGESQALQDAARLLGVRALLGFEAKGVAA